MSSLEVNKEGSRLGDREGDTLIGKGRKGALLTMVKCKTFYTVILRLAGKPSDLLVKAAVDGMKHIKTKIKTITFSNFHSNIIRSRVLQFRIFC